MLSRRFLSRRLTWTISRFIVPTTVARACWRFWAVIIGQITSGKMITRRKSSPGTFVYLSYCAWYHVVFGHKWNKWWWRINYLCRLLRFWEVLHQRVKIAPLSMRKVILFSSSCNSLLVGVNTNPLKSWALSGWRSVTIDTCNSRSVWCSISPSGCRLRESFLEDGSMADLSSSAFSRL